MNEATVNHTKICTHCKLRKPLDDFGRQRASTDGRRYQCRDCFNSNARNRHKDPALKERRLASSRIWKKKNRERMSSYARIYNEEHREAINKHDREKYARWRAENPVKQPVRPPAPAAIKCSVCRVEKPLYAYHKANDKRFGVSGTCKKCAIARAHAFYWKDTEKSALTRRAYYIVNIDKWCVWSKQFHQRNLLYSGLRSRMRRAAEASAGGNHSIEDCKRIRKLQRGRCAVCRARVVGVGAFDHINPIKRGGSNDARNIQFTCSTCNARKNAKDPVIFMRSMGFLI